MSPFGNDNLRRNLFTMLDEAKPQSLNGYVSLVNRINDIPMRLSLHNKS